MNIKELYVSHLQKIRGFLSSGHSLFELFGFESSSREFFVSEFAKENKCANVFIVEDDDKCYKTAENLKFYLNRSDIYTFTGYDIKPYHNEFSSKEVIFQRIESLCALKSNRGVIVCSVDGLFNRTIPKTVFSSFEEYLLPGEEINREILIRKIIASGYERSIVVEEKGTFSSRGYIIDIFPPSYSNPVRIEFFGDNVETLKIFDPETQRSIREIEELTILPASEAPADEYLISKQVELIKSAFPCASSDKLACIIEKVKGKRNFNGVEYYLSIFYNEGNTFFDWIHEGTPLFMAGYETIMEKLRQLSEKALDYYKRSYSEGLWLTPEKTYIFPVEFEKKIENFYKLSFEEVRVLKEGEEIPRIEEEFHTVKKGVILPEISVSGGLKPVADKLNSLLADGYTVFLTSHLSSQAERFLELLGNYEIPVFLHKEGFSTALPGIINSTDGKVHFFVGSLNKGFFSEKYKVIILTEEDIFGERLKIRKPEKLQKDLLPSISLDELSVNDYIVHRDYGIGCFKGLEILEVSGTRMDFILIEYAGGDKLYIPVQRLGLVQKFISGNGSNPRLDRLGGTSWERTKQRVRESVREMADELIKLYALRNAEKGFQFSRSDSAYTEFEAKFQKEETPDQLDAIKSVIRDMESPKIMDRLICGDVGYGKTEVAVRAAYKSVMDGKQVAVLVPTTVLAQQHFQTFTERFMDYPVSIEVLSRFKTSSQQREIIKKIKLGTVDIVIGTHRLLQKDIQFKDIGLLVVDEEQRFGVSDKEKIKKIKSSVDVLTLTATPIPRTLNMALSGIRDISTINTPPEDRLSIKTCVIKFSPDIIREAIINELQRGGQVFFVHNRVKSIVKMKEYLQRIVPEASIGVAHGQMKKEELENIMLDYLAKRYDVLLSSAIIESGLDIPSANTIIINRADQFGLAQLYQLRGRVGRSNARAYSYLMIPGEKGITGDAKKRLEVIRKLTELGSGIKIALHDLEIRGAGNLIGREQSGNIARIGFDMYTEILESAVKELKGEPSEKTFEPEINIGIPVFIPSDYIEVPNQRLAMYRRIAKASDEQLDDLVLEIKDRFGKPPDPVINLFEVLRIRNRLVKAGIKELKIERRGLVFSFDESAKISPEKIVDLITSDKSKYRFTPDLKLIARLKVLQSPDILAETKKVLHKIK